VAEVVLVGGSSRVPLVRALVAEAFGREPRHGVHPDEAVALGAAIQAGLKSGAISSHGGIMITDVCPFTLGVEVTSKAGSRTFDGAFSPIIPRNSTIPVSRTEVYSTTADRQRQVNIRIFQGESRLVKNNVFLDEYMVDGIPPGAMGHEKVAITFTYDVNGILEVTTKVVSTGKEASLKIEKSQTRMDDAERATAKQRLDDAWSGRPEQRSPAPAASPGEPGSQALLTAARARLGSAKGPALEKLKRLIADLELALARGDTESTTRLDAELTEALFELD
jgi:molecular chaperone DnaK